jgi:hypothetical protein
MITHAGPDYTGSRDVYGTSEQVIVDDAAGCIFAL